MTWQEQIPLAQYTTLKVGGPAEYFVSVRTEKELAAAIEEARTRQLSWRVIGGGSNILAPDTVLPGLTIHNAITGWSVTEEGTTRFVTIGAGEMLDRAVAESVKKEYWGIENLSHIPGTVGATPVQNVGAYGVEVADIIASVRAYNTATAEWATFTNDQCLFSYRNSIFKHEQGAPFVITSVTYALSTLANPKLSYADLTAQFTDKPSPSLAAIRDAVIAIRAKKFPDWTQVGTAGSFFKNPTVRRVVYERLRGEFAGMPGFDVSDTEVKIPLGWILDNVCGLRGATKGNVGTYQGQALVLINNGHATAAEIAIFAEEIVATVYKKTGINIEWEVTRW